MTMNKRLYVGFTLLEVIVAVAILAVSVAILMRIFAGSSGIARVTDDYYEAIQIAESQMALLLIEEGRRTVKSGRVGDDYRWQSRISEYRLDFDHPIFPSRLFTDPDSFLAPFQYDVTVTWGGRRERQIHLSTIRLGTKI